MKSTPHSLAEHHTEVMALGQLRPPPRCPGQEYTRQDHEVREAPEPPGLQLDARETEGWGWGWVQTTSAALTLFQGSQASAAATGAIHSN